MNPGEHDRNESPGVPGEKSEIEMNNTMAEGNKSDSEDSYWEVSDSKIQDPQERTRN
jgi:hypothetical protein